jgi:hypothetical protein
MLVRYDALGNQTLLKTYPQPKPGAALGALLPMADGGVIVGGGENATPSQWQSWKTRLQRLDAQGGQVWLNPFTPTQGSVKALVRRPDGSNVAMAEPTSAIGSTYMAFTDAGKLLWLKSYKGSTSTYYVDRWIAAGLLPASDGSVYAVGSLYNPAPSGTKDSRLAVLRLNAAGVRLWNAYVDVGFAGRLYGVTDRQGGGVWAVGAGRPAAGAVWQPWLVEVDASGKVVGKTLLANGPTDHLAMSVLRDGDELTIASYVYDGQAAGNRPELRRMHRGGKLLWKRSYVVQDSDYPFQGALVHTPEGGYRLGGTASKKMGAGSVASTLLIRTDPWGHAPCKATGKCAGKAKDACDDGDPKTADFCDAAAGCQHVAVP